MKKTPNQTTRTYYHMLKKSTNHYTQSDLKVAYQLVQADLFNSLLKAKSGQTIRFGNLGKFKKKPNKV